MPCTTRRSESAARTTTHRVRRAPGKPIKAADSILVVGAGSWGTALAIQFARAGRRVALWGRDREAVREMARERRNLRYLPEAAFPETLDVTNDLGAAAAAADDLLVAVPSHAFRSALEALRECVPGLDHLAWATKGFELDSGLLPHQVADDVFPGNIATAVLSGPTFAQEVGAGLPTAMTIASADPAYAMRLATAISTDAFRAYTSEDILGVEVGGATKNVFAIGAGVSDGLGFGANTRIALVTRGLTEMTRLGLALGAEKDTFMGLSGIGDLVLTCTDDQSRNRRFGLALGRGRTVEQARHEIGQVIEGYNAARAVRLAARRLELELPIIEQIYAIVHEAEAPQQAVMNLMRRPLTPE